MLFNKAFWASCLLATGALAHWKQVLKDMDKDTMKAQVKAAKAGQRIEKRQGAASNETFTQIAPPPFATVQLTPQYWPELGSKRTMVKYGNFTVPPMNVENGMADYLQIGAYMPCQWCTITYMHAGLEFLDGTDANADNNQWLHHVILIDLDTPDTVCGSDYYAHGQRFFASGNERTVVDLTEGKVPNGYLIEPLSTQIMMAELMNAGMEASNVVVTITYEYIEYGLPENWYETRPIWLDIAGCDIESDMPALTSTTFQYTMNPKYTSQYTGAILGVGGHIHDGGVNIDAFHNKAPMCNMVADYTGNPAYLSPKGSMMSGPGPAPPGSLTWMPPKSMSPLVMREHINSINICRAPQVMVELMPGDTLWNQCWYNFNKHAPMLDYDGAISDVMGISLVYMAQEMTQAELLNYVH